MTATATAVSHTARDALSLLNFNFNSIFIFKVAKRDYPYAVWKYVFYLSCNVAVLINAV
jgi:hypothetical protein